MKNLRGFKSEENTSKTTGQATQSAEELLKNYGNMSEDALFETLMREVAASKSNGTFSEESLLSGVQNMMPYLNETQKSKLEHLMRLITSN